MFVDMKMPLVGRLETHNRTVFAVVSAVRSDNVDSVQIMIIDILP